MREKFKNVLNAYCVVHFACCREIKAISEAEIDRLKEKLDEKRAKEREDELA